MTTQPDISTNGATETAPPQTLGPNDSPLIPGGEVGERFMNGEATEEDLALAMRAGSDTPDTQPEAAPAVTPEVPPVPGAVDLNNLTPEQIAAIPGVAEMQARERELQQQVQQTTQRDAQTQLDNAERAYASQAARSFVENDGLTPEVANRLALREAQRERQLYEQRNQMATENKVRMDTAVLYAKQYGVPAESLLEGTTAKEMELMARLQKLEAGPMVAPNGETRIPPQSFDNGLGGGSVNPANRRTAIGRGDITPTLADRDEAWRLGYLP